ncbi:MAG: nucleoside transporter C-terminal domain-containing protein [Candidatus Melainabacteria bacterium]|nr:nucleoside transporter C-terminal domain-containing protein [Candidatus Melainabacteria bacterium]
MDRYIGILGIITIIGVGVLLSENRRKISWRLVGIGLTFNVILGLLMLKIPGTSEAFAALAKGINTLVDFSLDGAEAVLGPTITHGTFIKDATAQREFIFAVHIGFAIIFVMGLISILYYFGLIQRLVNVMGRFLSKTLGLSGPESLSCAAAAFVGQVECQLLIKPYMANLTKSELFTTMTCAMATISGSALVMYVGMGMPGNWIIAASFMSALNGIIMAKIFVPETEHEKLLTNAQCAIPEESVNVFDAAHHGVTVGYEIAVKVVTMVAFAIAFMAMVNFGLGKFLALFGMHAQIQDIFAYPFMPIAWLLGVPWHECFHIGRLMATELLFNEVVSYGELAPVIHGAGAYVLAARTQLIATVALCGFAHLGSLGINIGGLGAMAPSRKGEIAKIAFKSMMVANMATWLSAAICGLMF